MKLKQVSVYTFEKRDDVYELHFDFKDWRLKKLLKSIKGINQRSNQKWFINKTVDIEQLQKEYEKKLSFKIYDKPYEKRKSFLKKYWIYLAAVLLALTFIFQNLFVLILTFFVTFLSFFVPFFYLRWRAVVNSLFKGFEILFFALMFAIGSVITTGFLYQPFNDYWCPPGYEELSTHSIITQFDMPGSVRGIESVIQCSGDMGTLTNSFLLQITVGYVIWAAFTISLSSLLLHFFPQFRDMKNIRFGLIRLSILFTALIVVAAILSQVEQIREPLSKLTLSLLYPEL